MLFFCIFLLIEYTGEEKIFIGPHSRMALLGLYREIMDEQLETGADVLANIKQQERELQNNIIDEGLNQVMYNSTISSEENTSREEEKQKKKEIKKEKKQEKKNAKREDKTNKQKKDLIKHSGDHGIEHGQRVALDAIQEEIVQTTKDMETGKISPDAGIKKIQQLQEQAKKYDKSRAYGAKEQEKITKQQQKEQFHAQQGGYMRNPNGTYTACGAMKSGSGYGGYGDAFDKGGLGGGVKHLLGEVGKKPFGGFVQLAALGLALWGIRNFIDGKHKDGAIKLGIALGGLALWSLNGKSFEGFGNFFESKYDPKTVSVSTDDVEYLVHSPSMTQDLLGSLPLDAVKNCVSYDTAGNPTSFDYDKLRHWIETNTSGSTKDELLRVLDVTIARKEKSGVDYLLEGIKGFGLTATAAVSGAASSFGAWVEKQKQTVDHPERQIAVLQMRHEQGGVSGEGLEKVKERYEGGMKDILLRKEKNNEISVGKMGTNKEVRVNTQTQTISMKNAQGQLVSKQFLGAKPEDLIWLSYKTLETIQTFAGRSDSDDAFYVEGVSAEKIPTETLSGAASYVAMNLFGDIRFKAKKGDTFLSSEQVVNGGWGSGMPDSINSNEQRKSFAEFLNGMKMRKYDGAVIDGGNQNPEVVGQKLSLSQTALHDYNVPNTYASAANIDTFDAGFVNQLPKSVKDALEKSQKSPMPQELLNQGMANVTAALESLPASLRNRYPMENIVFVNDYNDEKFPGNELGFYHHGEKTNTMVLDVKDGPQLYETIIHERVHHLDFSSNKMLRDEREQTTISPFGQYVGAEFEKQPHDLGFAEKYGSHSIEEDIATIGERVLGTPIQRTELLAKARKETGMKNPLNSVLKKKIELFTGYALVSNPSKTGFVFGEKQSAGMLTSRGLTGEEAKETLTVLPTHVHM